MNYKSLAGNAITAFLAQGIAFISSFAMSLLVPKVLGVVEFGYWQLFIFYANYSGFFHLGLNDGIYLLVGGESRDRIDKTEVNSQLIVATALQLIVGLAIISVSIKSNDDSRAFVYSSFAIYTILFNLQSLLGYLFQAMNETRLFSFSNILERIIYLIALFVLITWNISEFEYYVILYCITRLCSLVYCCWHARDFFLSGTCGLSNSLLLAASSIKVGFGLMLANVANMSILGVARALVDSCWGIEAFGTVSLSLSIVNFFISFVSQASMVLFPALRQGTEREKRSFYRGIRDLLEIVLPGIYLIYFPATWFLSIWLPQYSSSARFIALLLPVCVFNTKMDICCTTYLKVLRKERILLLVNALSAVGSALLSFVGAYWIESIEAVLMGAVLCVVLRSIWSEHYLDKVLNVQSTYIDFQVVLLTILFSALAFAASSSYALIIYAVLYIIYLIINRAQISSLKSRIILILQKRSS